MANHNEEVLIKEAIKSVLSQNYDNWELLIVDDASYDGSIRTIEKYLDDRRIKLIKNKNNFGYGGSCKIGVRKSSGAVIGFLDSDDTLRFDALNIIMEAYNEDKKYGFVYSSFYECDSELGIMKIADWVGEMKKGETNLRIPKISHFRTFRRKDYNMVEGFSFEQKRAVDRDIIYQLEEVAKFKFINEPLYYYRKNKKGISQGVNHDIAKIYEIWAKYKAYKRRVGTDIVNLSKYEMSTELMIGFIHSVKARDMKRSRFFISRAFILFPFNFKSYTILFYRFVKFIPYRLFKTIKKYF